MTSNAQPLGSKALDFGIVIPIINEQANIETLIARIAHALPNENWEAVFVDDGSTDGSIELLLELGRNDRRIRLVQRIGRRGLSTAVVEGMLATTAPIVGVIDGDLQHDETKLPLLFEAVSSGGADVAVGSRYIDGGGTSDWSDNRKLASRFATWLGSLAIPSQTTDPMSGFFATRRDVVAAAQPSLSGIGFKILIDLLASSGKPLKIVDVPYVFKGRVAGESKLDNAVAFEFLLLLIDKTIGRLIPTRLLLFLGVGTLGLGVHLAALWTALNAGATFVVGQTIAVATAITFNYALNNAVTYRDRMLKGWKFLTGLLSFAAISSVGAIANVGAGTYVFEAQPSWWLAGIAGAAMGAIWNYATSAMLTWKK